MDSVTPGKSKLARTFAKVLHLRAEKVKQKSSDERKAGGGGARVGSLAHSFEKKKKLIEEEEKAAILEALLANLFSGVSSVKASYSQLQLAQSPYDVDAIHDADNTVVSELKNLSELKQCFIKKQFDCLPENALALAEVQEQKSLLKTYDIMGKKLEAQMNDKQVQVAALRNKLEEAIRNNELVEKRLNQSGQLSMLEELHVSGITAKHFNTFLRHTVKSVRSFVRLMIGEMKSADWNIEAAADSIQPGVIYCKADHRCFAFESYVCDQMFDGFNRPNFGLFKEKNTAFLERFREMKSVKPREYVSKKPNSGLARLCRAKYLRLVHPRMETSFFGNLEQRNLINAGKFPETAFFSAFAEMAKRVLVLHYLAFSFQPQAEIYIISRGNRFSEVYMESVADEPIVSTDNNNNAPQFDPRVAFTVVPGFKIGNTVLQSQVYLSQLL